MSIGNIVRGLRGKLLFAFLAMALIPLIVIGVISYFIAQNALQTQAINQLISVRDIKKAQIENFFSERQGDMGVLIETVGTLREEAFHKLEAVQQIKTNQIEKYFEERRGDMGVLVDTVQAHRDNGFEKLAAVEELKKTALEDYFETMKNGLHVLKDDPFVREALTEFDKAFEEAGDRGLTAEWNTVAEKYDTRMQEIMKDNGWYNIFLIHTDGDIVYTVTRESDLGMSILDSDLKDSSLGKAFQAAKMMDEEEIAIADFAPYAPSGGQHAAFMMAQMRGQYGQLVGYVAFQMPTDKINEIVQHREGMGKTGETYLVGKHDGNTSYRSDRVIKEGAIGMEKTGAEIENALAGESGIIVKMGSTGDLELGFHSPLDIPGLNWMMNTTMSYQEAIVPQGEGEEDDFFARYLQKYGYYDLFLINKDGYVFYTVTHEADYQTNMVDGAYAQSNLGRLVQNVLKTGQFGIADFEPYAPSNDAPAAFIAQPVLHNGEVEVVVALQLSIDALNAIMQERTGLGDTGETYLVGSDKLMRSDSLLDPANHSVAASFANPEQGSVDTEATRQALAGNAGENIILDYNGNPVISVYAPLDIQGLHWSILAEIDVAEAFNPVNVEGEAFYKKYKEMYGYYDLFLINPDGYVFYTVTREADYQTNMVDGTYADSNLGKLVRQVLDSKQFWIADFAPYAPSNDEPAAFIAQPVVEHDTVEVVVALQLSLDDINAIMNPEERAGMGRTGETYLVGADYLMRSDSYLNPDNHSVLASFANPENGKVNTTASKEALAGKAGEGIISDYTGNDVLSAYAPLNTLGLEWAIIAEIHKSEAFQAVKTQRDLMLAIGGIATAVVIVLAMFIAGSIAKPMEHMSRTVAQLADGDLDVHVSGEKRRDEIGLLAQSMLRMITSLREMVGVAEHIASGNLTVEVNVRSEKDALGKALRNMGQDLQQQIKEMIEGINVLASSASEISASVTQMASSAAETSTSLSETTTTLEEVRQTSEIANQKSQQVSAGAQQAAQISQAGRKATEDTVEGMHRIREQMESIADSIVKLSEQSQTIGGIISTVNDLSDQSNLLAVNASIEAAKAGEQGKGFAVVAQEIRSLAEQSKQATTQVQLILNNIQKATSAAVMATEQGTKAVEAGVKQSSEAGHSIQSLTQNITDTAQAMTQIAASGQQQVIGMGQIADAMESIKQASVQNVDSSHQLESAAGNLQELGQRLKQLVDRYTV